MLPRFSTRVQRECEIPGGELGIARLRGEPDGGDDEGAEEAVGPGRARKAGSAEGTVSIGHVSGAQRVGGGKRAQASPSRYRDAGHQGRLSPPQTRARQCVQTEIN